MQAWYFDAGRMGKVLVSSLAAPMHTPIHPLETRVPPHSRIESFLAGASFHDSWRITSNEVDRSALDHFIVAARHTPRWVDACMTARNRVVRLLGLKDLGDLSALDRDRRAADYKPGDRVGIFTVFENGFDEALIGDRDKHLDVMLGVHRHALPGGREVVVTITTVVHVKNALGRLYMLLVKPMHRVIAPAVLATIGGAAPTA